MNTPARILRATVENRHGRPTPTERELAREDRFVAGAQTAFAEHRRDKTTVSGMARALRTSAAMLRHCFCDLDALPAEILHRHLSSLAKAFGEIPYNDPETHRKRRALYLSLTRTALGGLTEAHLLLVRDRHLLPPDLLPTVEQAVASRSVGEAHVFFTFSKRSPYRPSTAPSLPPCSVPPAT